MNALYAIVGLTAGNFIYQWFFENPDWMTATERSFFQATAILFYVFFCQD